MKRHNIAGTRQPYSSPRTAASAWFKSRVVLGFPRQNRSAIESDQQPAEFKSDDLWARHDALRWSGGEDTI